MLHLLTALTVFLLAQEAQARPTQIDPAIKAVVDRYFETQQAEDVEGYLSLWSAKATRPTAEQLRHIFDSGDDQFSEIAITRVAVTGDTARVRVDAVRTRVDQTSKRPDGSPRRFTTLLQVALALVREDGLPAEASAKVGGWKIVREGTPADELAAALIETDDPEARKAMLESEPDLANVQLVDAIARRADAVAQLLRYKAAQAIYERAREVARAIRHRRSEGQAIHNIANALYFQRDFPGALKLYEERLVIEREISNDEGIASALSGIGTVRYSTYEYAAALQAYRDALAIQEKLNDELLIGTTLISTGNVLYLQGDFDGAIADYRRAELLKRKNHDLTGAASALEGLGRVYSAQGDYSAALGAFNGVLAEWRARRVTAREAKVLQSIGEVHFRLGNTGQARSSFEEARRGYETMKDIGSAGRVLQGTALNELVAGRFEIGEKAYGESIDLCTKAGDPECIARAQVGLAFALAAQQKFDDAITWYGRSLKSFSALKMEDPMARARIGLAEALSGKLEHAEAFEEAVAARHTGVALGSDDLLWRALVSEARAKRKLEEPVEALGKARAALLAVQRMAAAALDRPGQAVPRDTTTAFATIAILQAEAGDAPAAFLTVEAMRAHSLRISLAQNERDIARGMTEEERTQERELSAELTTLILKRDRRKELPKPDKAEIEKLEAAISEMTTRRNDWREKLFARLPELKIWRGLAPAATLDDLTLLLDVPGKSLLQFVVDEHDTLVLVATGASPDGTNGVAPPAITAHVVTIERHELAERIGRALDGKALASVEGWRKGSADLFSILPSEIVDRLAASSSIVVVPDDVLWRVPFEAMPVETEFLGDRATVTYAASVGSIMSVPLAATADAKAPVVVVASPQLPPQLLDALKTTAPTWSIRPAEAAVAEVERIRKASGEIAPIVLSAADATEERFRTVGGQNFRELCALCELPASALHIAAPFRVNSAGPLFSPILLSPFDSPESRARSGQARTPSPESRTPTPQPRLPSAKSRVPSPAEDAELEIRDLFDMDPVAPVVMFSDPAALSKRDAAAAVATVHWAWRASGTTTTIFRRWGGDDPAATEVIGRFYEALRAGESPAEALRAARAAVRATETGRAPAAWAGWMILAF